MKITAKWAGVAWSFVLVVTTATMATISGCSASLSRSVTPSASAAQQQPVFSGSVHGGQQPVAGATINIFSVGTTGNGSSSTSLLNSGTAVTTNSSGGFSLTGNYTCPATPAYVFITASGGNPGLTAGTNNAALTLMAAVGLCSSLTANTNVQINELTTVGSVAALFPYMTSYVSIGSTNADALRLAAAMANVNLYVNISSGTAPGASLPSGYTASTAQLIALGDAIGACINSNGSTSSGSACGTLFAAATPSGGSAPKDTIGALIDIMLNPSGNPAGIFNIIPAAPVFATTMTQAPSSWALPILYPNTQTVQFASSTYSVSEQAGSVTLNVARNGGSAGPVSVNYATADGIDTTGTTPGNAVNGFTYAKTGGTLSWADGNSTNKTITIPITNEQVTSGAIIFTVTLSSPSGASIGTWGTSTVTANNNDPGALDFVMNSTAYNVNENAGSVLVSVKRQNTETISSALTYTTAPLPTTFNQAGGGSDSVALAVGGAACSGPAGPDYVSTSGTLNWTSSTSSPLSAPAITICDRGLSDGSTRAFFFEISTTNSGVNLGESTYAVVTITDNDNNPGAIAVASSSGSVNENAGVAEVLINRMSGSAGAVTASYSTANGTALAGMDYTAVTNGTLNWAAGDQTPRLIVIPVTDENLSSGSKTFSVNLASTTGGATLGASTTVVTINDNDAGTSSVAFSSGAFSVNENAHTLSIPVVLAVTSNAPVSVTYATADVSALEGTDYTSATGTLTWAAGVTGAQYITVPIADENLSTGSKTFNVLLGSLTGNALLGSPSSATITINDNDTTAAGGTVQLSAATYSTTESSGTVTISASRAGSAANAVTVNYATSDYSAAAGTDYSSANGSLSWTAGDTSAKSFTVGLNNVNLYSGTRTFYVTLSSPTGGAVVGTNLSAPVIISENDPIAYPLSDPFSNSQNVSYSNINDPVTNKAVTYVWSQFPANDFGPDPVTYNTSTPLMAISALPAVGVHPRLLFTAADLPAIQCRLTGNDCTGGNTITLSGQLLYKKLMEYDAGLKGIYSDTAPYTIPDFLNGAYEGSHGNTMIRDYKDPTSLWYPENNVYNNLANGVKPISVSTGQTLVTTTLWPVFAYEALYCLINNDSAGMQKLLAAATFELTNEQAARTAANTPTPYIATAGSGDAGFYFGYIYDFAYNSMTSAQVSQWTTELQNTTWAADNYGTLNAAVASRSNWATFTYRTPTLLDIYGQSGYNDIKASGLQRGMQNFMNYGIFPSGAFIEGEAKDQFGSEGLIMLARTGFQNLFQHPHLQAYVNRFLPGSVIPNPTWLDPGSSFPSGPFVRYDLLGGTEQINNVDSEVLHYMFPNNPVVDWLYQLQQGSNYQFMTSGNASIGTDTGYYDDLITAVPYMTDFNPANTATSLNLPLTYFSGERALMMTRSDWSTNAMMLNMHTRQFNGGHPMDDRNAIYIFGAGRGWSAINQWNSFNNAQSIVNIDATASKATPIAGLTSPPVQGVTTPARMVDFQDQPYATFAVGDASYCWSWIDTTPGTGYTPAEIAAGDFKVPIGSTLETHSKNSFAYTKLVSDEMNTPLSLLPSWVDYNGLVTPVTRAPLFATPVVKAFRTAGLVRAASPGGTPYGLVVDDVEVSASVAHHYDWQLLLVNDLQIMNQTSLPASEGVYDITLASNGVANPGDPVLLIRVLDMNTTCTVSPCTPYILPVSSTNTRADSYRPIFIIPSDSISPNFKVLIFPYNLGSTLPTTTWNEAHTAVTVNMPGYTDVINFSSAMSGKTDINIVRAGQTITNMNTPIAPLQ